MGRPLPTDTFAVPSAHRIVTALWFTDDDAKQLGVRRDLGAGGGLLFAVHDERGAEIPNGIAYAPDERKVRLAGLVLQATTGTYPVLTIASAPSPAVLASGMLCFLAGCGYFLVQRGTSGSADCVRES
jgi:hypothetical protein